jgi:hypothetical protein
MVVVEANRIRLQLVGQPFSTQPNFLRPDVLDDFLPAIRLTLLTVPGRSYVEWKLQAPKPFRSATVGRSRAENLPIELSLL